jgi:hypothetical protein
MDNNPHGLNESHDNENGFFSSDDEDDAAIYGIRAPRRSTAREWRFDSLRISHIMDMDEMLQILEDITSYMFSLLAYTLGLVAYLHCTGAAIQDKILLVIEAMAWLMCYAEMLILTIKDHLYFERFENHFRDPTNQCIDDLLDTDADDMTGFSHPYLRALMIHLRIQDRLVVNHQVFTGEECLLIFLYEICHGHTYTHMAKYVFGGDPRRLSDRLCALTDYLYTSFYHKISGNSMATWCTESNITRFRKAIWNRLRHGTVAKEVRGNIGRLDFAWYIFLNIRERVSTRYEMYCSLVIYIIPTVHHLSEE